MVRQVRTSRNVEVVAVEIRGDGHEEVLIRWGGAEYGLTEAFENAAAYVERRNEAVQIRVNGQPSRFEARMVYAPAVPNWKVEECS